MDSSANPSQTPGRDDPHGRRASGRRSAVEMAIERRFSIMHVILEPRYSGAETLVRDLVQIQRGQGHRTSIVAFRPAQADFAPEMKALQERGSELYIPPRSLEKFRRLKWVFAAIRDARPDI